MINMGFYDQQKDKYVALSGYDDFEIHLRENLADFPKANVILIHGMGETLTRYDQLAAMLVKRGFNVFRYDQPGHGQTSGEVGVLEDPQLLTDCCLQVISEVRQRYYNFSLFLLGHSMGGFTVLQTLAQFPGKTDGAIVSAPYSVYETPLLGIRPVSGDEHKVLEGLPQQGINRDERLSMRNRMDHTNPRPTVSLANALYQGSLFLRSHIEQIEEPLLMLHGFEDGLISFKDTLAVYERLKVQDKELHIYPYLMHSLLNDPIRKKQIVKEITEWLGRHSF